jgi:hypothetical protein
MKVREMTNAPKIEQRSVAKLVPYAANSRTHTETQIAHIAASIKEFGWTNPILIDGKNTIIAGHARTMAAQRLGMKDVPVIVLDYLSEAQQRALVIADNQLALTADWDDKLLQAELEALMDLDFDLTLLGWGDDVPTFAKEPDYSALDDLDESTNDLADGVLKAIQIEFHSEDYQKAKDLVDAARKRGEYVGLKLIEALSV